MRLVVEVRRVVRIVAQPTKPPTEQLGNGRHASRARRGAVGWEGEPAGRARRGERSAVAWARERRRWTKLGAPVVSLISARAFLSRAWATFVDRSPLQYKLTIEGEKSCQRSAPDRCTCTHNLDVESSERGLPCSPFSTPFLQALSSFIHVDLMGAVGRATVADRGQRRRRLRTGGLDLVALAAQVLVLGEGAAGVDLRRGRHRASRGGGTAARQGADGPAVGPREGRAV